MTTTYSLNGFTTTKTRFRNWGGHWESHASDKTRVRSTIQKLRDLDVKVYTRFPKPPANLYTVTRAKREKVKIADQPAAVWFLYNTHIVLLFEAIP